MVVKLDTDFVVGKMEELCSALLGQESFQELRRSIDEFAADEASIQQYESFLERHHALEAMEKQDLEPTQAEMDEYDREEGALYENPIIRKFLYAQREFNQLHDLVSQYLRKTVELNRLPEPKELKKGGCGCGGSCGCNH